jgi:bifunctional protein TilS/HprT
MTISFAHPSEQEYAELLDAHGVAWEYEPRTFVLEHAPDGRLLEAVTPDFYLPFAGVYVECTEMKTSLACRKRRKLRKLRERYGEIVVCLGRAELAALRAKYGSRARA